MQPNTTSRRTFIGSSILSLGAYWWAPTRQTPHKPPHPDLALARSDATAYICESGNLGKDSVFTLGLLLIPSPDTFEAHVQQMRQEYNYHPRLSYSTNDRYQLPIAQHLIQWLFAESSACFQIMAFPGEVQSSNPNYRSAPSQWQILRTKQEYYDQLLVKANIKDQMVYVKYRSPLGPSPAYSQYFFSQSAAYYQAIDTRTSNALQLCGLLTSCVAAAHTQRQLSPVKAALVHHLEHTLDNLQLRPAMRWKDRFIFYA